MKDFRFVSLKAQEAEYTPAINTIDISSTVPLPRNDFLHSFLWMLPAHWDSEAQGFEKIPAAKSAMATRDSRVHEDEGNKLRWIISTMSASSIIFSVLILTQDSPSSTKFQRCQRQRFIVRWNKTKIIWEYFRNDASRFGIQLQRGKLCTVYGLLGHAHIVRLNLAQRLQRSTYKAVPETPLCLYVSQIIPIAVHLSTNHQPIK